MISWWHAEILEGSAGRYHTHWHQWWYSRMHSPCIGRRHPQFLPCHPLQPYPELSAEWHNDTDYIDHLFPQQFITLTTISFSWEELKCAMYNGREWELISLTYIMIRAMELLTFTCKQLPLRMRVWWICQQNPLLQYFGKLLLRLYDSPRARLPDASWCTLGTALDFDVINKSKWAPWLCFCINPAHYPLPCKHNRFKFTFHIFPHEWNQRKLLDVKKGCYKLCAEPSEYYTKHKMDSNQLFYLPPTE